MRLSEVGVFASIIAVILMIIVPMPTPILDVLLSANIALSILILLISMYAKSSLEISSFPSILLVTTILRLSLNVSTTRGILSHAYAGEVVQVFGEFVIGGDAVVGIIIFLIIVLINFMVITKGSERVSEVAARFTLDAMPGKQMAIDADLNAGIITEQEAMKRREDVQRNADFYGAMDGASKFVKGDAIASIIITFINIIGGFVIGVVRNGMEVSQALQTYTLLTVGDGLVGQIPALMISVATGMIVTRSAALNTLSRDIMDQIFGTDSMLLGLLSGILLILGIVTPLPTLPNILLAIVFFVLSRTQKGLMEAIPAEGGDIPMPEEEAQEMRRPENVMGLLKMEDIELEFGYGLIPLADQEQGGDLLDRIIMIRRQIAVEMGVVVPVIRLRDNIQLNPNEYAIKIKGVTVAKNEVMFDHYLAMDPGTGEIELEGIDTVEPSFGLPAKWITEQEREKAEIFGYTVVDPPSVIATHLTEIVKQKAFELLGKQETKELIDNLREDHPAVVEDLVPNVLSLGEVQRVLSNLLREQISIRDLTTILETLSEYGRITNDTDLLTEYTRQRLSGYITNKYVQDNTLKVVVLDGDLEELIMSSLNKSETGSFLAIEPDIIQTILSNTLKQVQNLTSIGEMPIVLTAPIVRFYYKRMTEQLTRDLIVLSYNEIEPTVEVQSLGVINYES